MKKNLLIERQLIRSFLDQMNEDYHMLPIEQECCDCCGQEDCVCPPGCEECDCNDQEVHGASPHGELQADPHGVVSKEELYNHFDLDGNGIVTKKEYEDHVNWHCDNPDVLDHYQGHRKSSMMNPDLCHQSYDSASQYMLSNSSDVSRLVDDIMDSCGSTCRTSTSNALFDILRSLKDAGII